MPIREQQVTNKQHAIPQSIMSVEFKIIGDLTLKQFFFLLAFFGLAYTCYMTIPVFIVKWLLIVLLSGSGLCFAFLPLGDRGLDVWIINFLRAMFLPNQFVYRKQEEVPTVFLYQNLDVLRSELITLTPTSFRRKIEVYLEQQEPPVDKLDFDEKNYILKVREAYSPGYAGFSSSSVTTSVIENVSPTPASAAPQVETISSEGVQLTPATPVVAPPPSVTPQIQDFTELELPAPKAWQSQPTPNIRPITPPTPTPQVVQKTQPQQPQQEEIVRHGRTIIPPPPPRAERRDSGDRHRQQVQNNYYSPTMTPDMHIGRRFINLAEEAGRGEIILPIRGERVLSSLDSAQFDQAEVEKEAQKVQQLDNLINQIKSKEIVQRQIIESQKIKEAEQAKKRWLEEETQKVKQQEAIRINEENKRLEEQARLESEKRKAEEERRLAEEKAREQAMKEQARLQKLRDQEELLRRQKEELLKKQRQEELDRQKAQAQRHLESEPQAIPLKQAQIEESPTISNIVWGVVVTFYQAARTPVPAVVVVIRNQRKEVVRAVKTNAQGKFGITTPLINGLYTIEVDKEKRSGLTFDITAFEAKGDLIPTIEIVGKV